MLKKGIALACFLSVVACKDPGDCMIIREKVSSNGDFYFLNRSGDDLVNENVIVKQLRVPVAVYNRFSVGDEYCRE